MCKIPAQLCISLSTGHNLNSNKYLYQNMITEVSFSKLTILTHCHKKKTVCSDHTKHILLKTKNITFDAELKVLVTKSENYYRSLCHNLSNRDLSHVMSRFLNSLEIFVP